MAQENSYLCGNYLETDMHCNSEKNELIVDKECRFRTCEWYHKLLEHFKLDFENAQISMSYLDRFLSTEIGCQYLHSINEFQLVTITTIYLSIKLFEPTVFDMKMVSFLSQERFGEDQVVAMESKILNALQWKMHPPTPKNFVQHLLALLPEHIDPTAKKALLDVCCFQFQCSVHDYSFSKYRASTVAIASMLNAIENRQNISTFFPTQDFRNHVLLLFDILRLDYLSCEIQILRSRLSIYLFQQSCHERCGTSPSSHVHAAKELTTAKCDVSVIDVANNQDYQKW
eukprot:CAMPEP_0195524418 /NCGR_PEP_ID=MMETSP0794_2-20130614/24225_1 /TAXON_ID=515487 /ORGANISM="Stephanopyxis turris, Strain CCMP 815" /LENGTH=285 /DNA_ID=CAMNT_0040654631 /DNA_START=148 /DNA_END=1002 /DNA_ORIENTATION=+